MSEPFKSSDVASYLADMAQQLSDLAGQSGLAACAALFDAAQREAEWHSKTTWSKALPLVVVERFA